MIHSKFSPIGLLAFLMLSFALVALSAKADDTKHSFCGRVIDNFTEAGIGGARVVLTDMRGEILCTDSTYSFSEDDLAFSPDLAGDIGNFMLPVPHKGKYLLRVEADGYAPDSLWVNYPLNRLKEVFLPPVRLNKLRSHDLRELTVTATKVKMFLNGDTVVYNADAFNLADGSMLDGLIRMLPGVRLDANGVITVNGQAVQSLVINGHDFFKGNPQAALSNLPAYTVRKIKVFSHEGQATRLMGRNMNDSILTMDVRLKKEYSTGHMADIGAGYGTNRRYHAEMTAMRFNDVGNVMVYGKVNNLSDASIADGSGRWANAESTPGRQRPRTAGATRNFSLGDKGSVSMDLWWQNNGIDLTTNETATRFLKDGDMWRTNRSHEEKQSDKLNFKGALRYNGKGFYVNPTLRAVIAKGDQWSNSAQSSTTDRTAFHNHLSNLSHDDKSFKMEASGDGGVKIVEDLVKYDLHVGYSSENEGDTLAMTSDYNNTNMSQRNQRNNKKTCRWNAGGGLRYEGRFGSFTIVPSLRYSYDHTTTTNRFGMLAAVPADSVAPSMALYLSASGLRNPNDYDYRLRQHNANIGLEIQKMVGLFGMSGTWVVQMPISWKSKRLSAFRVYDQQVGRSRWFFVPSTYLYLFDMRPNGSQTELSANAALSYDLPEMAYMLDYRDDRDPLCVSMGNAQLRNPWTAIVNLSFSKRWAIGNAFFAKSLTTLLGDMTAMAYAYDPATDVFTFRPVSVDGNWTNTTKVGLDVMLDKRQKWMLKSQVDYHYRRSVDMVATTDIASASRSVVCNHTAQWSASLHYSIGDGTSVALLADVAKDWCASKREGFRNIVAESYKAGFCALLALPWHLQLSTDLTMVARRGYQSHQMNTTDWVWNAQLSRTFCKGRLLAKLQGYDILHELSTTSYAVDAQGRTETWHNAIPRYAMISLAWRFNANPKKK
ncbi:carboxypeptidase-like regulatory domain-containing protein [Hallella sp.]|uniref:carboxypeptidase-like regulatory domain-containing protein n=1 Tax=Hallella sp. TaxID=2980186 RepID=UPI00307ACF97